MLANSLALNALRNRGFAPAAPTVTASAARDGRTLRITRTDLTGSPVPSVALTTLTLDTVDVSANAVEVVAGRVWEYYVPASSVNSVVAWEITATNSDGSDTASGSETVEASVYTGPLYSTAEGETISRFATDLGNAAWVASGLDSRLTQGAVGKALDVQRLTSRFNTANLQNGPSAGKVGHTYRAAMIGRPDPTRNRLQMEIATGSGGSPARERMIVTALDSDPFVPTIAYVTGTSGVVVFDTGTAAVTKLTGEYDGFFRLEIEFSVTSDTDLWIRCLSGLSTSPATNYIDAAMAGIELAQTAIPAGSADGVIWGNEVATIDGFFPLGVGEQVTEIAGVTMLEPVGNTPPYAVNHGSVTSPGGNSLVALALWGADRDELIVAPDSVGAFEVPFGHWVDVSIPCEVESAIPSPLPVLRIGPPRYLGKDVLAGVTISSSMAPIDALRPDAVYHFAAKCSGSGTIKIALGAEESRVYDITTTQNIEARLRCPAGATAVAITTTGTAQVDLIRCRRRIGADGAPATIEHVRNETDGSDAVVRAFPVPVSGYVTPSPAPDAGLLSQSGADFDSVASYSHANAASEGWFSVSDGRLILLDRAGKDVLAKHMHIAGGGDSILRWTAADTITLKDVTANLGVDDSNPTGKKFIVASPGSSSVLIEKFMVYHSHSDAFKLSNGADPEAFTHDQSQDIGLLGATFFAVGCVGTGHYDGLWDTKATTHVNSCTVGPRPDAVTTTDRYFWRNWRFGASISNCVFGEGGDPVTGDQTVSGAGLQRVGYCEIRGSYVSRGADIDSVVGIQAFGWGGSDLQIQPVHVELYHPAEARVAVTQWDVQTSTDGGLTWTTEAVRGKPQQVWGAPRWRLAGKAGRSVRVRAHYCGVDGPWVYA